MDFVFYVSGQSLFAAESAPAERIPMWLCRRALFLLNRDWPATSNPSHIRDLLLEQTGIRIPDALMTHIAAHFATFNQRRRDSVRRFDHAAMHPGQLQDVPLVRPALASTARPMAQPASTSFNHQTTRPSSPHGVGITPLRNTNIPGSRPVSTVNFLPSRTDLAAATSGTRGGSVSGNAYAEEVARRRQRVQQLATYGPDVFQGARALMTLRFVGNARSPLPLQSTGVDSEPGNTGPEPDSAARSYSKSPTRAGPNLAQLPVRSPLPAQQAPSQPEQHPAHSAQEQAEARLIDPVAYNPYTRQTVSHERTKFPDDPEGGEYGVINPRVAYTTQFEGRTRGNLPREQDREVQSPTRLGRSLQAHSRHPLRDVDADDVIDDPFEGDQFTDRNPSLQEENNRTYYEPLAESRPEISRLWRPQQPSPRTPSPLRSDRRRNDFDFRGEDPNLHYFSSRSGEHDVDMRRFQPDWHQPPPPPRRENDYVRAAREAERERASAARKARDAASIPPNRAPKTTRPVQTSTRVTRSVAARRKNSEAEEADDDDSKPSQSSSRPVKVRKVVLRINSSPAHRSPAPGTARSTAEDAVEEESGDESSDGQAPPKKTAPAQKLVLKLGARSGAGAGAKRDGEGDDGSEEGSEVAGQPRSKKRRTKR